MNISQIAGKLKHQIAEITGILSQGLPKKTRSFVEEMVFGLEARGSVRLSEVSRSLEEPILLKKTLDRLCHQLKNEKLAEVLQKNLLIEAAVRIKEDTLLVIDLSDIGKKYAKKMEYLAQVHDGSEGKIARGYWTVNIAGVEIEQTQITPLYLDLYSQEAPDFKSENEEIIKGVDTVRTYTESRGIYVMDRGADRRKILLPLLERKLRFIIRSVGNRHLMYRGHKVLAHELAASCPMLYAERIIKEEDKSEKVYHIEFGYKKVKLPESVEQLYLVVVRGFGEEPMMLLTNIELTKSRGSLLKIVLSYVRRWQIEDTIRFAKQSYHLEDIRLRTYCRLKNMMKLALVAMYFTCVWLADRLRLNILVHHALKAAKRLFGIPDFRYYAIADGMKELFSKCKTTLQPHNPFKPPDKQLLLGIQ